MRPTTAIADAWSPSALAGLDLLNERPGTPVTVLPAGTENLIARHFGLPRDPETPADTIAAGWSTWSTSVRLRTDSCSWPASASTPTSSRHHQGASAPAGPATHRMAYVEPILCISATVPGHLVRSRPRHARSCGTSVFVFNLPGMPRLPFAPVAREDDGWLDLIVFDPGPFQALYYLWKVFAVFPPRSQRVPSPGQKVVVAEQPSSSSSTATRELYLPPGAALPPAHRQDGPGSGAYREGTSRIAGNPPSDRRDPAGRTQGRHSIGPRRRGPA